MRLKFSRSFLILFIITLVCSITPAVAIQTESINTKEASHLIGDNFISDMWNNAWNQCITEVLNPLDKEKDRKLTNQQKMYLAEHNERLIAKSETILSNLQELLNYSLNEYKKYKIIGDFTSKHVSNDSSTAKIKKYLNRLDIREENDKENEDDNENEALIKIFADNIIEIKEHLNTLPKPINVENVSCTYDELLERMNDGTYKSGIIIQIADDKYDWYMQVINITKNEIYLKSPKKTIVYTANHMKGFVMLNNKLNVLIVPQDCDTQFALDKIIKFQKEEKKMGHWSECCYCNYVKYDYREFSLLFDCERYCAVL